MIVIGAGRVGQALAALDPNLELIERDRGWAKLEGEPGAPILVATRNDDLVDVVARVPEARRADLVFVQNGMLRDHLRELGLEGSTRGLLFFAVPTRGADLVPGAPSPFWGPQAARVVAWFEAQGVAAREVGREAFAELELEKLVWNSAFGLLCEVHDADVGTIVRDQAGRFDALAAELVSVGAPAVGLDPGQLDVQALAERCRAYSASIPDYRGAVKEWRWRNGWFVAAAKAQGVVTPLHDALLHEVGRR